MLGRPKFDQIMSCEQIAHLNKCKIGGATMAQWIRLRLPGLSLKRTIYPFIIYGTCAIFAMWKEWKNKQKRPGLAHLKNKCTSKTIY